MYIPTGSRKGLLRCSDGSRDSSWSTGRLSTRRLSTWSQVDFLQAVPSGHCHAVPHAGYFPISPRTLRLAHLLARQEPYSSKKRYVPPGIRLLRCETGYVHAVPWSD